MITRASLSTAPFQEGGTLLEGGAQTLGVWSLFRPVPGLGEPLVFLPTFWAHPQLEHTEEDRKDLQVSLCIVTFWFRSLVLIESKRQAQVRAAIVN